MKAKLQAQRPKPAEFIEFRLRGSGAFDHPVYKWLRGESGFQRAEKKFCRSQHYQSLAPGNLLKLGAGVEILVEPGMQELALLEFAQRVAYCLGQYLVASESESWKGSASQNRKRAARDYNQALQWSCKGFGPYDAEDRRKLEELLTVARDYVLGKARADHGP